MSPPTHFDVSYEINPWMDSSIAVRKSTATDQWNSLHSAIRDRAAVTLIDSAPCHDFVFTANAGLTRGKNIILSSFFCTERQVEEHYWKQWFEQNGYRVHTLKHTYFEGAGDALFAGDDVLIGGYGFRSERAAYDEIKTIWPDIDILPVELVDPRFYHLDTCLAVLDPETILYYPDAFSKESQELLEERFTCIAVSASDAAAFVCNAIVIGSHIILPAGAPNAYTQLESAGYTVESLELGEFMKAGGAAKCLTLCI